MSPYRIAYAKETNISYAAESGVRLDTCSPDEKLLYDDFDQKAYHHIPVVKLGAPSLLSNRNSDKYKLLPVDNSSETLYISHDVTDSLFLYVNNDKIFINTNRISINAPTLISRSNDKEYFKLLLLFLPLTVAVNVVTFPIQFIIYAAGGK